MVCTAVISLISLVCNFLTHEKCLRDIVTVCPAYASTQILVCSLNFIVHRSDCSLLYLLVLYRHLLLIVGPSWRSFGGNSAMFVAQGYVIRPPFAVKVYFQLLYLLPYISSSYPQKIALLPSTTSNRLLFSQYASTTLITIVKNSLSMIVNRVRPTDHNAIGLVYACYCLRGFPGFPLLYSPLPLLDALFDPRLPCLCFVVLSMLFEHWVHFPCCAYSFRSFLTPQFGRIAGFFLSLTISKVLYFRLSFLSFTIYKVPLGDNGCPNA